MNSVLKKIKSQTGATLIELLVASGLLAITAQAFTYSLAHLSSQRRRLKLLTAEDRQIYSLVSSIRHNLSKFQVDSVPVGTQVDIDETGSLVTPGSPRTGSISSETYSEYRLRELPVAWSEYSLTDVANCPECPGRLGYVIQPYAGNRGLYQVKVRVTNPKLYGDGEKRYKFTVNMR